MKTTTNIIEFGKTSHTVILCSGEKIHHCVKCDKTFTCEEKYHLGCNWSYRTNSHLDCDQAVVISKTTGEQFKAKNHNS